MSIPEQIFKGAIIEESLEDGKILNNLKIIKTVVTDDEDPRDRWHIHTIEATKGQLEEISKVIKPKKFYAHFWDDKKNIIAVFRDKIFEFKFDNEASWQPAILYGLSVDIPREQLDFLID
ncbi:MAG: hypothetical protein UT05_C0001G0044 [Parcubacteria group bacterium GW2011_GWF2_38_76]|nr:MAG: hypothetical protein UT05_C0001G0044 [Parcubacteria group bacterium GW2011_GWF2_38_76]HBM45979.1 hypothetical protein [Patescibacteria group bacterium]